MSVTTRTWKCTPILRPNVCVVKGSIRSGAQHILTWQVAIAWYNLTKRLYVVRPTIGWAFVQQGAARMIGRWKEEPSNGEMKKAFIATNMCEWGPQGASGHFCLMISGGGLPLDMSSQVIFIYTAKYYTSASGGFTSVQQRYPFYSNLTKD